MSDRRLGAQQVEVLGRRARHRDRHVVLGAQLQEALDARRAVVRALTLVAVREEQGDRAALAPLGLAGGDELVDDGHRAVDEVAELGLPEHQRLGAGDRVAVLEAERGVLAEQRVVDVERCDPVAQVLERGVLAAGQPVDEGRVALDERAAARVLAGQAHRDALHQQRAEGQQLAEAPVDAALGDHLRPALEQRRELRVRGEALGQLAVRPAEPVQDVLADGGVDRRQRVDLVHRDLGGRAGGGVAGLGEDALELRLVVLERLLGLLERDVAATDEVLGVGLPHRALVVDDVVHRRLRHRGVVALVVAPAAVADEVDDDVLLERLPELERQPRDAHARLGVVAVDVEDRRLDGAGDVGRVDARCATARARW